MKLMEQWEFCLIENKMLLVILLSIQSRESFRFLTCNFSWLNNNLSHMFRLRDRLHSVTILKWKQYHATISIQFNWPLSIFWNWKWDSCRQPVIMLHASGVFQLFFVNQHPFNSKMLLIRWKFNFPNFSPIAIVVVLVGWVCTSAMKRYISWDIWWTWLRRSE